MMLNRLSLNRIGLNRIGLNRIGKPSGGSSDRPYIDPKVLDSLCGVWIMDQNTNESESRNIIKNKIADRGGDLELLNFAYKANSGYNSYPEDFTSWGSLGAEVSKGGNKAKSININFRLQYTYSNFNRDVESFKVKISNFTKGILNYYYRQEDGTEKNFRISPKLVSDSNGVIELPKSYNTIEGGTGYKGGFLNIGEIDTNLTIEQLPLYEGALVTDGKDDIIVSQKTVQEMLGGSNVCTVVSMIHQINLSADVNTSINNIRSESVAHVCARHLNTAYGKTGIFGYSKQLNTTSNPTLINNILGDKKDYIADGNSVIDTTDKYFVQGYKYNDSLYELSEVAVYWTFISNKVLTTDEINQIIAYFKLDKYVTPQVIYDVKRQGLTNDTPAADWYLKDFSGNGHDMQLYNFAKKLGSGIGKYEADYSTWTKTAGIISTPFGFKITEPTHNYWLLYTSNITVPAHKVKISGIPEGGEFRYLGVHILKNGINELPKMEEHPSAIGFTLHRGTTQPSDWVGLSVEQIPDYEGALVSDGIDDYGYADNLPIYKDYTVVADYARLKYGVIDSAIVSKSYIVNNGAFAFNLASRISPKNVSAISFGVGSPQIQNDDNYRKIRYQSKYINDSVNISAGTGIDSDKLWISCLRENKAFSESALYSILLFPYSLSEFLLERQLKKYKLGTLYPGMIEWRPIFNSNVDIDKYNVVNKTTNKQLSIGDYFAITDTIELQVYLTDKEGQEITSLTINGKSFTPTFIDVRYLYNIKNFGEVTGKKSPQKINITIDEYIRYEDIVQPYPAIINLKQDGKTITWGDKLKVGSDIVFAGSANLLPELYTVSETRYNGVTLYPNTIIKVEKSMVFDNARTYLKANEPSCILSPNRLRIPNSSYKILGYIPDLTGKGNHGKLNNFAYTEDSGVASDGSIKIDGTDDHITISNIIGGKCIMAKVTVNRNSGIIYDQRRANVPNKSWMQLNPSSVIFEQNAVSTYIDGILNHNVTGSDLVSKTVNLTCELEIGDTSGTYQPTIGSSYAVGYTTDINLYEFMLFPDVPDEEEIKELNDVMGIEGGYVESPNYYWDAYGKKNTDTDRNLIADQVSKDVANALEVKNVAYNSESGYTDDNGLLLDGVEDHAVNTVIPAVTDFTVIAKREFPESALVNNQLS